MTDFSERSLLGGWSIVVSLNGITVGHIREMGRSLGYGYFHGQNNSINARLQDSDLESLKEKVDALVRTL